MAGGDDLKLLGMWASPFVLRVKLALSFKGLSYEYVEEDLFGGKSELLLKSNPVHNKVPVLIHNGKPVCESLIILQYIDEAFAGTGPSLLPADPYERAVARFWAAYIDDKILAAWMQASRGTEEDKAEGKKQWSVAVETLEGALRDCGKGKPFFGGDSVGYVDVVLGGLLGWMHANEEAFGIGSLDPQRTPLLVAWSKRFGALETVEPVMPDVSRLVELGKMVLAREAAAAAGASN